MKDVNIKEDSWIFADGYRKQILANQDDLQNKNTLAQVVVIEPGHVVKPHYHNSTIEFYYVMEGEVTFTINDITSQLKTGDMMITEPKDIHSVKNVSSEDFKILVFKTNTAKDDTIWL